MKYLKKINKLNYLLIAFIIFSIHIVSVVPDVSAKTVRDLKNELAEKKAEAESNRHARELTEAEMASVYARIGEITEEKSQIEADVARLNNEIIELNQAIVDKNDEIKNIINYYQLSSTGEAAYMEYLFKSKDFTDFIYRFAVAEQLSQYNEDLIDEYNNMIVANEKKKEELAARKEELSVKQEELRVELEGLSSSLSGLQDISVDIEDEIKALEEYIDIYQNQYDCGDDDDIDVCTRDQLPPGTAFYRPVVSGSVSADYGYYSLDGGASYTAHFGIDFGVPRGTPVYASANGKVAATFYQQRCGGNMVLVQHYVGGQTYTSLYAHLSAITVSPGEIVTTESLVGYSGGSPLEYWDQCAFGAHLHFQMSYGLFMSDYYDLNSVNAYSFDPRLVVNIPPEYVWFSNRTTRY